MSDTNQTDRPPAARVSNESADAGLPRPIQDHLGRQLRAEYHQSEEKPAFLGDTLVPPEFDEPLQRLELRARARIHERGVEAVQAALEEGSAPAYKP